MTVERREEPVAGRHIRRHLVDLRAHVLAVCGVPNVGIVAFDHLTIYYLTTVFLPRRYDVEDVGPRAVGVAVGGHPHHRVVVLGYLRNKR